ncbi:alpha/beta fold hydrolase [Mesorhizobium sp. CAU 1732]|uniref:alpha/beta fold hydrolase n=1 Tax=Mesorhizobium sp. CAU 1732 TaxID=3140358 RepID=UPI003261047D
MPTLLLIPGLSSTSLVWTPLGDALEGSMPAIHADVTRDDTIPAMAARLLSEHDGELIAVGHSMGGRVAMEMARQAPARLRGLVLANTGHNAKRDGEEVKRQQMIDLGHDDIELLADTWLPPMLDPARVSDLEFVAELKAMVVEVGADTHERQIRALLARPDAKTYLPGIACPILLVAANQDGWSPVAQHREIADAAPDAELAIVDGAGHFAPIEQPQQVNAAIIAWLNRKFGGSHG